MHKRGREKKKKKEAKKKGFSRPCFSGWWNNSRPDWKKNTMIAGGAMFVATALVFSVSARNERRFRAPDRPIPSQRWASHTLEDDPDYYEKRAAYHENKAPLLTRVLPDKGHHH